MGPGALVVGGGWWRGDGGVDGGEKPRGKWRALREAGGEPGQAPREGHVGKRKWLVSFPADAMGLGLSRPVGHQGKDPKLVVGTEA